MYSLPLNEFVDKKIAEYTAIYNDEQVKLRNKLKSLGRKKFPNKMPEIPNSLIQSLREKYRVEWEDNQPEKDTSTPDYVNSIAALTALTTFQPFNRYFKR